MKYLLLLQAKGDNRIYGFNYCDTLEQAKVIAQEVLDHYQVDIQWPEGFWDGQMAIEFIGGCTHWVYIIHRDWENY